MRRIFPRERVEILRAERADVLRNAEHVAAKWIVLGDVLAAVGEVEVRTVARSHEQRAVGAERDGPDRVRAVTIRDAVGRAASQEHDAASENRDVATRVRGVANQPAERDRFAGLVGLTGHGIDVEEQVGVTIRGEGGIEHEAEKALVVRVVHFRGEIDEGSPEKDSVLDHADHAALLDHEDAAGPVVGGRDRDREAALQDLVDESGRDLGTQPAKRGQPGKAQKRRKRQEVAQRVERSRGAPGTSGLKDATL